MKCLARYALPLLAGLVLAPVAGADAPATGFDLGAGVSEYRRFLVYPHVQKGFAAMAAGQRETALAEFGRARQLLPGNPRLAVYHAEAMRHFGQPAAARQLLTAQLRTTPDDAGVKLALAGLQPAAAAQAAATASSAPAAAAALRATDAGAARREGPAVTVPRPAAPALAAAAPALSARVATAARPAAAPPAQAAAPDPAATVAQTAPAMSPAAPALPLSAPAGAELDARSYRLLSAGARDQALQLLLQGYPFADATPALRLTLLQRITLLADAEGLRDAAIRARLARPLETPALRSAQAGLFAAWQDCATVRELLGDLAPEYGRDDWLRLGDCYRDSQPGLAQHAYATAWKRYPDAQTARALAYQAFTNRDYSVALATWQSLTPENLAADDLMAAITTAITAEQPTLARDWLAVYARRFGTGGDAYWWRLAQAQAQVAPQQAEIAVQEAIARQPRLDYYLLLAALQEKAGASEDALATRRTALAQDPGNAMVLLDLAYASERAGRLDEARRLFEAVRREQEETGALTEQLVYLALQQGDFTAAHRYTREAIDLRLDRPVTDSEAQALFGLRRLHEDLGRRWNLNADLFTGAGLVSAGTSPATSGTSYRSYMQLEAEYRLEGKALPPRLLAPYVRLFAGSGEEDSALPLYSPMLGAGLRLRPWRRQNVAFALEQQLPLDNGPDVEADVMLRASGSWLDGGRFSADWHALGNGWASQSLYLDLAHFVDARRSAATADYRLAWQHKTGNGHTLEPYGHLQYNVTEADARDEDVRAGLGLRWNRWFGETRHDAWRHKASVGLEFQHAFHTWLADQDSLSLNLGLHW